MNEAEFVRTECAHVLIKDFLPMLRAALADPLSITRGEAMLTNGAGDPCVAAVYVLSLLAGRDAELTLLYAIGHGFGLGSVFARHDNGSFFWRCGCGRADCSRLYLAPGEARFLCRRCIANVRPAKRIPRTAIRAALDYALATTMPVLDVPRR